MDVKFNTLNPSSWTATHTRVLCSVEGDWGYRGKEAIRRREISIQTLCFLLFNTHPVCVYPLYIYALEHILILYILVSIYLKT